MEPGSVSPMLAALGNPPTRYADFSVEAKYDGEPGLAIAEMVSFETLVISHLTAVVASPWLTIGAFCALGGRGHHLPSGHVRRYSKHRLLERVIGGVGPARRVRVPGWCHP